MFLTPCSTGNFCNDPPSRHSAECDRLNELDLSEEDTRAVREGLSEEHLAVFDKLCSSKDNLDTRTRNRVKQVAQSLIEAMKIQLKQLENWRDQESTLAQVKSFIYDYLYSEETGLPVDTLEDNNVFEGAHK